MNFDLPVGRPVLEEAAVFSVRKRGRDEMDPLAEQAEPIEDRGFPLRGRVRAAREAQGGYHKLALLPRGDETFTFFYRGVEHVVEKLGEGEWHTVYSFKEEKVIELNGIPLEARNLVLKVYSEKKNPQQCRSMVKHDLRAYKTSNVPLPRAYVTPEDAHEMLWIVQRLQTRVTCEGWKNEEEFPSLSTIDRTTLLFARGVLTQNALNIAQNEQEFANDFRPDNVMLDEAGAPCVIDWSLPEDDEDDQRMNLNKYLEQWSNGNDKIFEFLIADFPEQVRADMRSRRESEKQI